MAELQDNPEKDNQEPEDQDWSMSSGDMAAAENAVDPVDYLALEEYAMRKLGLM